MAKYEVQKKYLIIYLCILIACFLLTVCRWMNSMVPDIAWLPDAILLHITNFSLSLMLLLAFGFTVLVFGGTMKAITVAGLLIVAFNLVYEVLFPIMNTPDIADALSGTLGVVLAYVYLTRLKTHGLILKP